MPESEPRLIRGYLEVLAGFARVNPARQAARRLLGRGRGVGLEGQPGGGR